MKDNKHIENSIITKFRAKLYSRFVKAIIDYKLIEEGDKVCVAMSGGKDSLLLAKLIQESIKHGPINFEAEFISMNPGYLQENLDLIKYNCEKMEIPVKFFDSDIFDILNNHFEGNPCYMCARMRRGKLYKIAQELGCNKIALGHHFNDVIETTLLNVLYSGNFKTMVPKLPSDNFPGITLIRPLYYVREKDILHFMAYNEIKAMNCGCTVAAGETPSKRREIKELIANLKLIHNDVDLSIFNAANNVHLEAVLGYNKGEEKVDFLEIFKNRAENV